MALTLIEREIISRGVAASHSICAIASALNRPASTISHEIRRNRGYDIYHAVDVENPAWAQALKLKLCKLATNKPSQRVISNKLTIHWSPEQIAGWLKRTYPEKAHKRALPGRVIL